MDELLENIIERIAEDPTGEKVKQLTEIYKELSEIEIKKRELDDAKEKAIYEADIAEQKAKEDKLLSYLKLCFDGLAKPLGILGAAFILKVSISATEHGVGINSLAARLVERFLMAK